VPSSLIVVGFGALASAGAVAAGWVAAGSIGAALIGAMTATLVSAAIFKPNKPLELEGGRQETTRQPITHWQWIYGQHPVGGAITFIHTETAEGTDNKYLHMVITFAGHAVEEIGTIWFDDVELPSGDGLVASGRFANVAEVYRSKADEAGQPFPNLVARSGGKWTDAHRQSGRAKIHVVFKFDQDIYSTGIPNVRALVKGRKVLDPRTGLTVWSDNAALCIADYIRNNEIGLGCSGSEIDEAQLIAAANICDEEVALAAGGTEKRYTLNGALSASGSPREILPRLLDAYAGHARFIGGLWKLQPGVYQTPTITLTEDDLRGGIRIRPRSSKRDLCNAVKGLYVSPENDYQVSDFPPILNATYQAEDQGERIWHELDLAFTNSPSMAQRIAKIVLEKSRQQIVVEWAGKLGCYRVQPGNTVMVTLPRYGWHSKVFEVASMELVAEGEDVTLGCNLVLRETASAVYDWSAEETTVDIAPDSNLPNPFTLASPSGIEVSEQLVVTPWGVAMRVTASWSASPDAFVSSYQPEYRENSSAEWVVLPIQTSTSVEIFDLAPGIYDFRVRAFNHIGVASDYTTLTGHELLGIEGPPSTPTGLSLQIAGGTAIITLDQHPDLDVRMGGRILVRHTESLTNQAWEEAFSIGNFQGWPGDSVVIFLPLKPGSYLVKAEDLVGTESVDFAVITTKQASVLNYTQLATPLQEDPTFPGTKTNCEVISSTLRLTQPGGIVSPGATYQFAVGFDFGLVRRARITGQIEAATYSALDLIDSRVDPIDDWLNFDNTGGLGSGADVWLETREADQDPLGSPQWSVWKRLDAGEYTCRAMQFRLQMESYDPTINVQVDVLRVKADGL
jgi:hypothetical protein